MVDKKKLLDEVMRREKMVILKRVLKYGAFILIFGAIYTFSEFKNYDRVKFSNELSGVVKSISTDANQSLNETNFVVALENKKTIKIFSHKNLTIKNGDVVKVLREELESGRLQYSFVLD